LIGSIVIRRWFQPVFAGRENGFVQWDKLFRGRLADETSSQDRDRNPGCWLASVTRSTPDIGQRLLTARETPEPPI